MSKYFDYSKEPRRAILFIDVKSNYASIECVQRSLPPLDTSLCVMSRADNSSGLILASSPKFKEVFGMKNVSRARDLPFLIDSKKFNYSLWYRKHTDIHGRREEPTIKHVAFIESWAKRTLIVPPQMQLYVDYKIKLTKIFSDFTSIDEIHSYSIDESFLDVTEALNFFFPNGSNKYIKMEKIAKEIQLTILKKLGLYVTVGMGDNPLLAKVAMDIYAKHNKNMRALIRYEDVPSMLWTIDKMTDFWGIGQATEKQFNKIGIHSIKELANGNPNRIKEKMGIIGLQHFFHVNGIDESNVKEKYVPKSSSFSNSQILPHDYHKQGEIELVIREMVEKIAIRLRREKKYTSNISVYIGASFQSSIPSINKSINIEATYDTNELQRIAIDLFRTKYKGGTFRQIAISANKLSDSTIQQLSLFDFLEDNEISMKEKKIQKVVDEIRDQFDFLAIQKASSLLKGSRVKAREKLIGGHSAILEDEEKKNDS